MLIALLLISYFVSAQSPPTTLSKIFLQLSISRIVVQVYKDHTRYGLLLQVCHALRALGGVRWPRACTFLKVIMGLVLRLLLLHFKLSSFAKQISEWILSLQDKVLLAKYLK
jgi:hypothetical protein